MVDFSEATEGFRCEIKNFLHGCPDLETQRAVRSRKSKDGSVMTHVATPSSIIAPSLTISPSSIGGDKGKDRVRERDADGCINCANKGADDSAGSYCTRVQRDDGVVGVEDMGENSGRMILSSADDDAVVETGINPSDNMVDEAPPGVVEEIIDKETAYETLQEMRVTLEQSDDANVNKNPPNTARQVLWSLRVNKQMMTH